MNWYYSVEGLARGPVNGQVLEDLAREGAVVKDTLVWHPEMEQWETLQKCQPDLLERIRKQKLAPPPVLGTPPGATSAPEHAAVPATTPPSPVREKPSLFGRFFSRDKN